MRTRRNGRVYECIAVDLNTQGDFFGSGGACRIANADALVPALRNIVAWTRRNQVPTISSMDSHRRAEVETCGMPPHCLDGTLGQQKLNFTLLPSRVSVEGDNTLTLPLDLFERHQQVIFRKRSADLLGNPKADRFLSQVNAREYLIFGLGLERSVKALCLGLLARNRRVTLVADGCGYWNATAGEFALRQMAAKGVAVVTVEKLLTRRLPRPRRYTVATDHPGCPAGRSGVYPACPEKTAVRNNGRRRTNGRLPR